MAIKKKIIKETVSRETLRQEIDGSEKQIIKTKGIIIKPETEVGQKLLGLVEEGKAVIEKDTTAFNKQIEEEEKLKVEKDKLPLDKILDIAKQQGLLKDLTEEQRFDRLIKGIKLHDIIRDCMQSSLNNYCVEYNKKNPEDNLSLKLHLRKVTPKQGVVFSASLVLEAKRRGLYKILLNKSIAFTHVKQVRDEASWKYSLYGNMFNDLIAVSINHLLLTDDVQSGRIKSDISKG